MSRRILTYITPEEYLRLERQAEYKSEYLNGEIFAMSGASREHNLITANIGAEFNRQLRGKPCESYISDMRVKVRSNGLYTYPDVIVVCADPQFEDKEVDTLLNPTLLIEVLSPSTEKYDRIAKTSYYRTIDSLNEHLLVAQSEIRIEQFIRQPNTGWLQYEYLSLDDSIKLPSIECALKLSDIYDRITFEPKRRVTR
ncbi:MAG TPA: Uma2 family endonuclease [Pyrinomonadaceae bacterium]|jgi:Uma2 family endonuclease|nr:Uma2 family endonuclease [Pyrinomonadaceae bacterium]